jgi:hypothetical protein
MQTQADRMRLSHVSTLDPKIAPVAVTVESVRQLPIQSRRKPPLAAEPGLGTPRVRTEPAECLYVMWRAEEARTMAELTADPDAKRMMIRAAETYEVLASTPAGPVLNLSNTHPDFSWWAFI